jgi:protein arginine kinase activator
LHITEIISEEQIEDLHLCEECAHKYLHEVQMSPSAVGSTPSSSSQDDDEEISIGLMNRECPVCGLKFIDFRNTGRLGCAHDYDEFREQLAPLLENIHGETRHCGKTPRRLPQNQQTQSELVQLRRQLVQAVNREAYEEAAQLRDRIRRLEEG